MMTPSHSLLLPLLLHPGFPLSHSMLTLHMPPFGSWMIPQVVLGLSLPKLEQKSCTVSLLAVTTAARSAEQAVTQEVAGEHWMGDAESVQQVVVMGGSGKRQKLEEAQREPEGLKASWTLGTEREGLRDFEQGYSEQQPTRATQV